MLFSFIKSNFSYRRGISCNATGSNPFEVRRVKDGFTYDRETWPLELVNKLNQMYGPALSRCTDAQQVEIIVNGFLDGENYAQRSDGRYWKELTETDENSNSSLQDNDPRNRQIDYASVFQRYSTSNSQGQNIQPNTLVVAGDFTVFEPPTDSEKWITIESESYIPSREEFIVQAFKVDFPHLTSVDTLEKIGNLSSRSPALSEWLARNQALYAIDAEVPLWASNFIPATQLKSIQSSLKAKGTILKECALERERLANQYQEALRAVNERQKIDLGRLQNKNYVMAFSADSSTMPLSVQLAIENFTPTSNTEGPQKRAYAKELLTQWRQHLLYKVHSSGGQFDVQNYIDEMALK